MELFKMPGVVLCEFKKNDLIIQQGEKVEYIYYLVTGTVYRESITDKGAEIIYGVREPRKVSESMQSFLGVLITYSNGISSSSFIAKTKCTCYRIPKELFVKYIKDKPEILNKLLKLAMGEVRYLISLFQDRHEGKVANRLCAFLLDSAIECEDQLVVSKSYNNVEISRFLGIHKVTVSRILRVLREENIIIKEKEGIRILDRARLESYAKAEKVMIYKKS